MTHRIHPVWVLVALLVGAGIGIGIYLSAGSIVGTYRTR